MASSPPQTERPDFDATALAAEMVEYDHYIDEQIEKTSAQVRWVDISAALMTLATGWLGFLLLAALVDHWVVAGGLGHVARFACWSALVGGTVMFSIWRIVPLVVRRINPVYAAGVIEREEPSLKNSLVNFLLLRATPRHLTRKTYQALEESAAHGLSQVPIEHIVDRSGVIKVGSVLMAVIVIGCVYKLVSPKDPLRSVGRIVIPWSDLAPASRVTIEEVEPGSTAVFNGQTVDVSAVVTGAGDDEPVTIVYSTSDTRVVDRAIVMERPDGSFRHRATLPEEVDGFEQDVEYYIAAGDAQTPTYRVTVSTPPAMVVESVQYSYPAYTGLGTRTVPGGGDLKALEGTRVTIRALANRDIDDAFVDFECDGRTDLVMTVEADGRHATSTFTLEMADDGAAPKHDSYQLRFAGDDGQENPRPTRHRIEVLPDTPPEVHFELPGYDGIKVPENAAVRLEVHAEDSDFSLGEVTLFAEHNGKEIVQHRLLGEPLSGEFVGQHDFRPGKFRLRSGDEVMYWAEARDMRQPLANRTETVRYRMLIVEPSVSPPPQQADDKPEDNPDEGNDEAGDEADETSDAGEGVSDSSDGDSGDSDSGEEPPGDDNAGENDSGEEAGNDAQPGKDGGEAGDDETGGSEAGEDGQPGAREAGNRDGGEAAGEPIDPTANPGDAFEEILRHREESIESSEGESDSGDNDNDAQDDDAQDSDAQDGGDPNSDTQSDGSEDGTDGDSREGKPSDDGADQREPAGEGESAQQRDADVSEGDEIGERDDDTGKGQSPRDQPQEGQHPDGQSQDGQSQEGQPQGEESDGGESQDGASDNASKQPGDSNNAPKRDDQPSDSGQQSGGNEKNSANEPSSSGKPTSDGDTADGQQPADKGQQDPSAGREEQEGSTVENSDRDDPAGSQTQSEKPSEAQGGQQGDRSGRGQEGSGQKADQEGTGGAGKNTAADEGGSASEQPGDGPTGNKPGDKPAEPGQGGKEQPSEGGSQQQGGRKPGGQEPGEKQPGGQQPGGNEPGGQQHGGQQPGGQQPGGKPGQSGQSGQSGQGTQGAGKPGGSASGSPGAGQVDSSDGSALPDDVSPDSGVQQADGSGGGERESNPNRPPPAGDDETTALEERKRLEEAREATNLALEHIRDQLAREQPDQKLLDRLGWTRDDMQRFLAKWEEMNGAAQRPGDDGERAQNRLDKMLRGLGITPRARKLSSGGVSGDNRGNLSAPRRVAPPRQYADQYEAYTEGAAKGREKD